MMNELIYLDTNIYLDYLENREDRLRPLGEFAFRLFQRTLKCEFKIIFSDLVNKELEKYIEEDKIRNILDDLKESEKLVDVAITSEDREKARMLTKDKKANFNDALHAVLAQKAKASTLITRNIEHFADFQDLIDIQYPESI